MSTGTLIKAHLDLVLSGGCHHGANRSAKIVKPYAVFHLISAVPENGITQYLGKTRRRYQIDIFASSAEMAESMALGTVKYTVETAINGTLVNHLDGNFDEVDGGTFRYITEFIVWSD